MMTTSIPMNMAPLSWLRRSAWSAVALLALAQLAGCAQPPLEQVPPDLPPALDTQASEDAAPAAALPVPADSEAEAADSQQPVIIRGNDRTVARQPSAQARAPRGEVASFKFDNAPVGDVVQVMLRDLLKVDYVLHPPLQGTVTLVTRAPISADRALLLLETALQANGIVMARDSRGVYHVGTPDALRGIQAAPAIAEAGKPLPPGYGAVVIPLRYLGANEMANILKPIVSPDAIVRVDNVRNLLVMRGTRAEAEGWLDLVATFDVNLLRGMSVGVFPLKYTSTDDVAAQLGLLSGATVSAASGAVAAHPPAAPAATRTPAPAPVRPGQPALAQRSAQSAQTEGLSENNPLFGAIRIMPIDRINAIMVVTPRAEYLDEMRYWIEQFDRPDMNSNEPQLYVYKIKNGSADHLADLLNGIYGNGVLTQQTGGGTGVAPGMNTVAGINGNVGNRSANNFGNRNTAFGNNTFGNTGFGSGLGGMTGGFNSGGIGGGLAGAMGGIGGIGGIGGLNQGSNQGQGVTTTLLGDTVRVMADHINNTLLIRATPAEYARIESTLKRLDVQRAQVLIEASIVEVTLNNELRYGLEWSFNNNHISINGNNSYTGTGTLTNASSPGSGFTWTLSNPSGIKATLSALADKSLLKVISSPSLLVLDNQTATIQVGDQVPTVSNTSSNYTSGDSAIVSSSVQYQSTGVMLGVMPSVTAGDLVTMTLNQQVTDVDTASSAALAGSPAFMQRQINTQVAVRSGETIVLGGLIKDTSGSGNSGIPLLSNIPIIGALFGTHNNNAQRTELLIIITPRVLRSDEDARAVSREMRDRMRGLTAQDLPTATAPGTP